MTENDGRLIGRLTFSIVGLAAAGLATFCGACACYFAQLEADESVARPELWGPGLPWFIGGGLLLCGSFAMMIWTFWVYGNSSPGRTAALLES
ncbi:MAG: hypothetical protein ACJ73J_10740 [Actinomycetes bacterium]